VNDCPLKVATLYSDETKGESSGSSSSRRKRKRDDKEKQVKFVEPKPKKTRAVGRCELCGNYGHNQDRCVMRDDDDEEDGSAEYIQDGDDDDDDDDDEEMEYDKETECYVCGDRDHWTRDCPTIKSTKQKDRKRK
jgi:hypothetical protein